MNCAVPSRAINTCKRIFIFATFTNNTFFFFFRKFLINVVQPEDFNQKRVMKRLFDDVTIKIFVMFMNKTNLMITKEILTEYFFQGFYVKYPRKHHFQKIIWLLQHQPEIFDLGKLESCLEKYYNTIEQTKKRFLYTLPRCPADKGDIETQKLYSEYVPIVQDILDNLDTCKICFVQVPETGGSCGHKVLCETCYEKVDTCPQCTLDLN